MRQNDEHGDQGIESITPRRFLHQGRRWALHIGLVWFYLTYVLIDGGASPDSQEIPNAYYRITDVYVA